MGENSEATQPRPFGDTALELHERGLCVFPCGAQDGKKPLVRGWQRRHSAETITAWTGKFPDANIGLACGASGVVIVDVDKPDLVEPMLERFGATPLITRTPSGGAHLWYRKVNAVPSGNLRSEGLAVDIRADGGQIIVPPSFNRQSGKPYLFELGSWDDLAKLPRFRDEALAATSNDNCGAGLAGEGHRNVCLHRQLLRLAGRVSSFDALLAEARRKNAQMLSPPLPDDEVVKTARSVWKWQVEGRNWVGSQGNVIWPVDQIMRRAWHKGAGDAFILASLLGAQHARRPEAFAVAARAMAAANVIPGWTEHRIRQALKAALELRLIERVHRGGRRQGDPSLYRFCVWDSARI